MMIIVRRSPDAELSHIGPVEASSRWSGGGDGGGSGGGGGGGGGDGGGNGGGGDSGGSGSTSTHPMQN